MTNNVDRTLSEDPKTVVWLEDREPYHEVARTEPLVTECGLVLDTEDDSLNRASETLAIGAGHRRCGRCNFGGPLGVYMLAAKEFHLDSDGSAACGAVSGAAQRDDVVVRGSHALVHNGIEPCADCFPDGLEVDNE